ncbi:dephospho-CoA kinase [Corynebacterium kutscheri]|uniref:Dephospho-CoA kinase n=1 Tax=Corynebacterium kutscheri TaxID=35755 RepID=A0AB38VY22_9CORY|nr:dephospho-CoA kinase [Corynebacterium kutscheri]VEH07027.1 dephospho-CoA kinase [Corynebacterium kutscheri]VEH79523.1 dephospho-CoA kinase [Corynebacterium kutscheri]
MKKIGLTGGIGSGKSTVARMLAEYGYPIIDADLIAREIVAPNTPALSELAKIFGQDILYSDGSLNRSLLAQRAFATEQARLLLNQITHPRIEERTQELFRSYEAKNHNVVVWDMPLLVDHGHHKEMDVVLVVDAEDETRVQRLICRGLSEEDARQRIAAQISREQRNAAATFILDNNGSLEELETQLLQLIKQLPQPGKDPNTPADNSAG